MSKEGLLEHLKQNHGWTEEDAKKLSWRSIATLDTWHRLEHARRKRQSHHHVGITITPEEAAKAQKRKSKKTDCFK